MIKNKILLIVALQVFFFCFFGWIFYVNRNLGLSLFLIFCVALPLYFCHILSGYIAARMGFCHAKLDSLLVSPKFLRSVVRFLSDDCEWRDAGVLFLFLYILAFINTLLAIVVRSMY